MLPLEERPPAGNKAEEENSDALLKGTPEVAAISSASVAELYCLETKNGTFSAYRAVSFEN